MIPIDPSEALDAINSAVNLVKKAANTAQNVESLGPFLGRYFDAKVNGLQVVLDAKSGGFKGSALGKAFEIEMAIEKHRQFEEDVKNKLFFPNHMDLWNRIKARANAMEAEFAKAAKKEKDAAAKRKKEAQEALEIVLGSLAGVLLIGMVGYGIYQLRTHG
jgi:preprotein translocase subunit Sss1